MGQKGNPVPTKNRSVGRLQTWWAVTVVESHWNNWIQTAQTVMVEDPINRRLAAVDDRRPKINDFILQFAMQPYLMLGTYLLKWR